MKNTRDLFRENLREIITRRSVKLEVAAELCDVSLSFLNQLLSGKSAYSPETIDKICNGLKCSPSDLFSQGGDSRDIRETDDISLVDVTKVKDAMPADRASMILATLDQMRTLSAEQLIDLQDALELIKNPHPDEDEETTQERSRKKS